MDKPEIVKVVYNNGWTVVYDHVHETEQAFDEKGEKQPLPIWHALDTDVECDSQDEGRGGFLPDDADDMVDSDNQDDGEVYDDDVPWHASNANDWARGQGRMEPRKTSRVWTERKSKD